MQQEWLAERLIVWASHRLAALVPVDMSLVPSADARPSSPDQSVVVAPGSSPASVSIGQSILAPEVEGLVIEPVLARHTRPPL